MVCRNRKAARSSSAGHAESSSGTMPVGRKTVNDGAAAD